MNKIKPNLVTHERGVAVLLPVEAAGGVSFGVWESTDVSKLGAFSGDNVVMKFSGTGEVPLVDSGVRKVVLAREVDKVGRVSGPVAFGKVTVAEVDFSGDEEGKAGSLVRSGRRRVERPRP